MKNLCNQIIKSSFIIFFGFLACLPSQAQFGGVLNKLKNEVEKNITNKANDSAGNLNQPTNPPANLKSTPSNICEKIKSSPYFAEYAEIAESVYKIGAWLNNSGTFSYDTQDKIVTKWLITKINNIKREDSVRYSLIERQWEDQIEKCAKEYSSTNLLPLFVNSKNDYNRVLREIAANPVKTNTIREADASGNIVTKQVTTGGYKGEIVKILDSSGRILNEATIPTLLILLDTDSKFTSNVHLEIKKEWAPILANIDNSKKRDAEFAQKQVIAENERVIALQKQKDIEQKKQQEDKERVVKIQKGDYKSANSCIDILTVLDDKIDQNDGASIKPHQGLKASAGKLARFSGDNGIILFQSKSVPNAVEFKVLNSTVWFGKNDIRINSDVLIIGKYTSNTSIKLTNGSSIQSPVLELICIQPS